MTVRMGTDLRVLSVETVAIRTDCEPGFVKGDPALDWGFRGKAPVIDTSGKPALQNRIHLTALEPISHSAALSRLALIERAQRFSITISPRINQKGRVNLQFQASNQFKPIQTNSNQIKPFFFIDVPHRSKKVTKFNTPLRFSIS